MSRWRPPAEKSTALITGAGHARLKVELDELWRVRRPEVVKALAAAAAEGDRSENAEYTYRKKQLGEIDRRVRYLSEAAGNTESGRHRADGSGRGVFRRAGRGRGHRQRRGHRATASSARTKPMRSCGCISIDSPLARAMLKKRVDDEFEAALPGGLRASRSSRWITTAASG